ncbi:MAG: NHLP bacteriocin export ABC transporter permease/ATPase subunit [Gemmatimonadota bacterium]|nr:NHLP bacteriocin export ABC transporter permease/ATPase subunit [Gemmatimonadota bacterium]
MSEKPLIERISGVRIETGAHRPFPMDDTAVVYFVEQGYLDVFAVELEDSEAAGRRNFVARVPAGEMAFGSGTVGHPHQPHRTFGFLAVPSLDAVIVRGERDGVASDDFDLAATSWIDEWISRISEFVVQDRPPPRDPQLLEAEPDVSYAAGSILSAQHLDVIWVGANAPMSLAGRDALAVPAGGPLVPVTERTWLRIDADTTVSAVYTPAALLTDRFWEAFEGFSTRILEFAILAESESVENVQARRRIAHDARSTSVTRALGGFERILAGPGDNGAPTLSDGTPLHTAAAMVASSCGASLEIQSTSGEAQTSVGAVEGIARRSGIRTRWISLEPGWWRQDGPSLVGFTAGDGGTDRPLALISDNRGTYRAVDPVTSTSFVVDENNAGGIAPGGLAFYAPLPERIETGRSVLRFSLHRQGRDLRTVLLVGILGGMASLLTPILTGEMLVRIIPRAEMSLWSIALIALLLAAFGNAVFEIVRGISLLRIEGRVDERLQSAIWSRLISLRAPFFRDFTVGDLENRANGISEIRRIISFAAVGAAMGGIFSVFNLALLFYYSWSLALYVCGMLFVLVGATWLLARGQLRHYRDVFRLQGAINGFVFQLITGLAKLRVANSETFALARWARRFAEQKQAAFSALKWTAGQYVVIGMFHPLALIVIFESVQHAVLDENGSAIGLAGFLSFNAAFGQLTGAVIALTSAVATVIAVIPLLERARPIFDGTPETADGRIELRDVKGELEFSSVNFRYGPEASKAIDSVSFRIRQGDYVAFVGPSGCGKSTLYRLLLGFEKPESGTVFLDGNDLSSLDLTSLRRRMGVVLQNGQIVAGNIFENIAGMSPLSDEEAWASARAAALEDDIRAMPMGMHTVLPEGGVGLSAGQKQRLLIARAFARKPRILLFDEATSALDNRAQAVVQASLKGLGVTRVVIAHRLSSIRDVDRIYVLDAGRIVESGSYRQLIERNGVFAALARRQTVQSARA